MKATNEIIIALLTFAGLSLLFKKAGQTATPEVIVQETTIAAPEGVDNTVRRKLEQAITRKRIVPVDRVAVTPLDRADPANRP